MDRKFRIEVPVPNGLVTFSGAKSRLHDRTLQNDRTLQIALVVGVLVMASVIFLFTVKAVRDLCRLFPRLG